MTRRDILLRSLILGTAAALPGLHVVTWQGMVAPAGTPPAAVDPLAAELAAILALPEVPDNLAGRGSTVTGHGPERFATLVRAEAERRPAPARTAARSE